MKVRNGYVSNSSSSSYIITIETNNEVEKECSLLFDFFVNNIKKHSTEFLDNFSGSIENYIENVELECEELEKDINWAIAEAATLKRLSENEDAVSIFDHWKSTFKIKDIRQARMMHEYGYANNIDAEVKKILFTIKQKEKKLKELKEKITTLKKNNLNGETKIYSLEVDHQDKNYEVLREILKSSWIKIIEEKHT